MDFRLKIGEFFKLNYFFIISFVFLYAFLIFKLIIPFFLYNELISWDLAGLYFSVWYQKYYLFPDIVGWNKFFFLGYAQNQFYPPLFSYAGALLSFVTGVKSAVKILFAFTVLIIPASFYYFARAFDFSRNKSGILTLIMTGVLFLFPKSHYGGNIHSIFNIGLVTHALGMAFFFFYWGSLEKNFEKKKFLIPSLLFSAIILTHIVASFAAAFLFFSYLICKMRSKEGLKFFIFHGILTFLLTAFWTLPFLAKRGWLEAYPVGKVLYPEIFMFISFIYIVYLSYAKKERYFTIGFFFLILIMFSALSETFFIFPVHLYRFMMFFYVLIPVILFSVKEKQSKMLMWIFLIAGAGSLLLADPINANGPPAASIIDFASEGRIFVMAPYSKESSPHMLQHLIPLKSKEPGLRGLYAESAKNARSIFGVENELALGDSIVWGTYVNYELISNDSKVIEDILAYQLNLLGVKSIVSWKNYSSDWKKGKEIAYSSGPAPRHRGNYTYYVYEPRFSGEIIEVLNYTPRVLEEDWDFKTSRWFLSRDIKNGIYANERVPGYKGKGNEKIEILEESKRQDHIKFRVESKELVPILIKISDFPNWKAYQDGKKIKIYRASPYIMLVYGNGEIEIVYERLLIDKISMFLTGLGFLLLTFIFLKTRKII